MGRARTESGSFARSTTREKVYAYLAKVPGTPWFFIAEADQKEMESDLKGWSGQRVFCFAVGGGIWERGVCGYTMPGAKDITEI
jgi:hypothetical protein